VRGTPQQIIEKYQMLARDAQLSNDRVAAENFLQHAEHYTRMLAEAMREMAAEQEARQQQYQQNGGQGGQGGQHGGQGGQPGGGGQNGGGQHGQPRGDRPEGQDRRDRDRDRDRDRGDRQERGDRQDRGERRQEFNRDVREDRSFPAEEPALPGDVIDLDSSEDSGLIETPESSSRGRAEPRPPPSRQRQSLRPRKTARAARADRASPRATSPMASRRRKRQSNPRRPPSGGLLHPAQEKGLRTCARRPAETGGRRGHLLGPRTRTGPWDE
jgi:hypothetical protein